MNRLAPPLLTALCLLSILPTGVCAQEDHQTQMPFQGYLTDDTGIPLTDTVSIQFRIYQIGIQVWTETQPEVSVVNGIFDVQLGSVNPLTAVTFDRNHELGISVNGDPEMVPRTPLLAAPYAMNLRGAIRVVPVSDFDLGALDADNIVGGKGFVSSGIVGATISGGGNADGVTSRNQVYGDYGTVGGGRSNAAGGQDGVGDHNPYATVGGGRSNRARAQYSTVPGGYDNRAEGGYSFAAGYRAQALHAGTLVWADSTLGTTFPSTGENQFLIRAGGGVGIGTNQPSPNGVTISRSTESAAYQLEIRNVGDIHAPNHTGIAFTQTADGSTHLGDIKLVYHSNGFPDLSFGVRGTADAVYIKSGGNVGIGTTSPATELDVNGTVTAAVVTETSDARLKRDVAPIDNAVSTVSSLQGVTFNWDQEAAPDRVLSDDRQIGLIAQEVQKHVPEVVSVGDDGYYSVAYAKLVPLLIEAIKEEQAVIEAQNERISRLEARITP